MTTHQQEYNSGASVQTVAGDRVLSPYEALRAFGRTGGLTAGYAQAPSTLTKDVHAMRTFVPALQSRLGVFVAFAADELGDRLFEKEFSSTRDRSAAEVVVGVTDALKKYAATSGSSAASLLARLRAEVAGYIAQRPLAPETTSYLQGDFVNQVALALDADGPDALVDTVAGWYAPHKRVLN